MLFGKFLRSSQSIALLTILLVPIAHGAKPSDTTKSAVIYQPLPAVEDVKVTQLLKIPLGATLSLASSTPQLSLKGKRVVWREDDGKTSTIAGLAIREEQLIFKWIGDVPAKAENALRNSVAVTLKEKVKEPIALRGEADPVESLALDFRKSTLRIECEGENLPPVVDIRFEFIGKTLEGIPLNRREKKKLSAALKPKAQAGIHGTVDIKKRDDSVYAEIRFSYGLPSGEISPLSISKLRRNQKDLSGVIALVPTDRNQAKKWIYDQESHLKKLGKELEEWSNMVVSENQNGANVLIPALVTQRSSGIARTRREGRKHQKYLEKSKKLIANLPTLQMDLKAIESIVTAADDLHGAEHLHYRFYSVVEEYEIELLSTADYVQ